MSFEQYIPKGTQEKKNGTNFQANTFSESNPSGIQPGHYAIMARGEPDNDRYYINAVNPDGSSVYFGTRRVDNSKPTTNGREYNNMNFHNLQSSLFIDTTDLEAFLKDTNALKQSIVSSNGTKSQEYKQLEKQIIFTLADMQRVWASEGNYNTDIIPSAGKVGTLDASKYLPAKLVVLESRPL